MTLTNMDNPSFAELSRRELLKTWYVPVTLIIVAIYTYYKNYGCN
jgi:hypothetical protein